MTSGRAGKVADPTGDVVVDHEREIGLGCFQLSRDFSDERGIGGEGDLVRSIQRCLFNLWRESVALLESREFERVDGGEQPVELIGELWIIFKIHAAGEHGVDSEVEVLTGCIEMIGVVVINAGFIAGLSLVNEGLHLLSVLCRDDELGGLPGLIRGLLLVQCGRCGIGGSTARRGFVTSTGASSERQEQQRRGCQGNGAAPEKGGSSQDNHQPSHCKGWTRQRHSGWSGFRCCGATRWC